MQIKVLASSSKGNAIYINDEQSPLLLDCGLPFKKLMKAVSENGGMLSQVRGVLVSHEHKDHCMAVSELIKRGTDCYMSKETKKALDINSHRAKVVKPLNHFYIGSWTILPFEAIHDVYNIGFLLESKYGHKLVYLTDSPYCKYRFKNLTHILLAVNYNLETAKENEPEKYKRLLGSHMSLDAAKDFIKANKTKKLKAVYLLHLSNTNSDEKRFKREIKKIAGVTVYVGV